MVQRLFRSGCANRRGRSRSSGVGGAGGERLKAGVPHFLTIGSQNQDQRGVLSDAEVLLTVPGYESLVTIMGFAFVLRVPVWLESSAEADEHFPREGGLLKNIACWIRKEVSV